MKIARFMLKIFIVQIILFTFFLPSYALEKGTHFEINRYIAENTIEGFSLDEYLKEQLGFDEGVYSTLEQEKIKNIDGKSPTIFRWLAYGGKTEDEPIYLRSFRHFHNPLEPWDEAGLWGTFESSVIWAQRTNQIPGGHYSWQDVRGYFYQALTSQDESTRENYFAETFRGLGQLMHLVEDASVPLHTRNDAHLFFNYEKWVEQFRSDEDNPQNQIDFDIWLSNESRYGYNNSVLDLAPNPLAPIAIAKIIDTDKYTRNNPEVTKSEPIGIAEYSNANFLSNGTIPGTIYNGDFLYPFIPDLPRSEYDIVDPRDTSGIIIRPYFETGFDNDVDGRYRLATVPIYVIVFGEELGEEDKRLLPTSLDNNVYRDYAERLIPRAVGYSAGLLNYFFRGEIALVPDDEMGSGYVVGGLGTSLTN